MFFLSSFDVLSLIVTFTAMTSITSPVPTKAIETIPEAASPAPTIDSDDDLYLLFDEPDVLFADVVSVYFVF